MNRPRKKQRTVYIHDPRAEDVLTASTATNRHVRVEINPAPPPSPQKRREYDAFDQAMGYERDDPIFVAPSALPEGPAGIKIKNSKRKKGPQNTESVSMPGSKRGKAC
jgi:hypothetical protein